MPADALSHVADALQCTPDRQSLRSVCKYWRTALDNHWQRGCFLSRMPNNPTDKAARLLPRFKAMQRLLWPRLRQLDLVELNAQRAAILLSELTPSQFPHVTCLALSSALQEHCADGGKLARLQLQLQHLCLYNIRVKGGLANLTHLRQLTALHVSATVSPGGGGTALGGPEVQSLAALTGLQVRGNRFQVAPRLASLMAWFAFLCRGVHSTLTRPLTLRPADQLWPLPSPL